MLTESGPVVTQTTAADASDKTRAALLSLADNTNDTAATLNLLRENQAAIDFEMNLFLHASSDSPLLECILSGLASHARFFCDELDDPSAWVARCANLEARRIALDLIK